MSNFKKLIIEPLRKTNPVTVLVLGICSCLAVTAQLKPALVMGASVTVVTALSNLIISLLRKGIPSRIRIIVQLVVVATLVILIDQFLKAFATMTRIKLYPSPLPNPSKNDSQGPCDKAKASKRPMMMQLVMISPT